MIYIRLLYSHPACPAVSALLLRSLALQLHTGGVDPALPGPQHLLLLQAVPVLLDEDVHVSLPHPAHGLS